jgi:L-asparagine transporter-like permease
MMPLPKSRKQKESIKMWNKIWAIILGITGIVNIIAAMMSKLNGNDLDAIYSLGLAILMAIMFYDTKNKIKD